MSLQFVPGPGGSGKSHRIYEDCIKRSMAAPDEMFYIIVPKQMTLLTQQEVFAMHPRHGSMNIDIIGFTSFAYRVFEELHASLLEIIDDTSKIMLLRCAVEKVKSQLSVLQFDLHKTEYIEKISATMHEFSMYCQFAKDSELRKFLQNPKEDKEDERYGYLKNKLSDIFIIRDAYEKELAGKYMDKEEVFPKLLGLMGESDILKQSHIYIDGFDKLSPIQMEIVKNMLAYCKDVTVSIMRDRDVNLSNTYDLFYQTASMEQSLRQLAANMGVTVLPDVCLYTDTPYRFLHAPALAHLQKYFAREKQSVFWGEAEGLYISNRQNPVEELKAVLQKVDDLVKNKNYRYSDIAILTDNIESYTEAANRLFAATDIPYFVDVPHNMLDNNYVGFLLSVLKVMARGFYKDDVVACLKYYYILPKEEVDVLEDHVIRFRLSGEKRWQNDLEIQKKDDACLKGEELRRQVYDILLPLWEKIGNGKKTVSFYIEALHEFMVSINLKDKIEARMDYLYEHAMYETCEEYRMVYEYTEKLFDQCVLLLQEEEVSVDEMIELLESGFHGVTFGMIPPTLDRLIIGDLRRSRIGRVKTLFIIGANEGSFPKSVDKTGILSNGDRSLLKRMNIALQETVEENSIQDRLLLYRILTKPSEALYLSYADMDSEGHACMVAGAVSDIRNLFEKGRIKKDQMVSFPTAKYAVENLFLSADTEDLKARAMLAWLASKKEYQELLKKMLEEANMSYAPERLEKSIVKKLYPSMNKLSATMLEEYSSCRYKYFLERGLRLRTRDTFDISRIERGQFFHAIFEYFLEQFAKNKEYAQQTKAVFETCAKQNMQMSKEQFDILCKINEPIIKEAMAYATSKLPELIDKVNRYEYYQFQYKMWEEEVEYLSRVLVFQNYLGSFTRFFAEESFMDPEDQRRAEKKTHFFKTAMDIPDTDCKVLGTIDRFDLTSEDEDTIYYRILDYKSSKKSVDLAMMISGVQLQLPLYMHAVSNELSKKQKKVVPVGAYYFKAKDDVFSCDLACALDDAILYNQMWSDVVKNSKLSGMTNKEEEVCRIQDRLLGEKGSTLVDGYGYTKGELKESATAFSTQEFAQIDKWLMDKIKTIHETMKDGCIEIDPYQKKTGQISKSACDYCNFKGVCRFDPKLPGYTYHQIDSMQTGDFRKYMQENGYFTEEENKKIEESQKGCE